MKVLHVDMGKEWRGGQRQCALLHTGLLESGIDSHVVGNQAGELVKAELPNTLSVPFKGEVSLSSVQTLRRVIAEVNPDIVHSHEAHSLTPLILLKILGADFQLVHTRRVDFSVRKNVISLYKYKNRYVNIAAISEGVKKVLVKDGINPEQIRVIYSGVPAPEIPSPQEIETAKQVLGMEGCAIVVGTVANFSPHKDLATLLQAYKLFRESVPASVLLMVGEGPLYGEIKNTAEMLGISDQVIFTGFRSDVPVLMKCMDIFAVSSELEGLNTSIIDAMHLSLPVVSTDTGGIGELVEPGVTGCLSPVKDFVGLAENLVKLAVDKERRKQMGVNAATKAARFTDKAMVEGYIKFYRDLLK